MMVGRRIIIVVVGLTFLLLRFACLRLFAVDTGLWMWDGLWLWFVVGRVCRFGVRVCV